jgi:hypothetical protein
LNEEILSKVLYDILIAYEIEECLKNGEYSDISSINIDKLNATILYWYQEHIIELVLKNINQDKNEDPVYWKLKITVV